MITPDLFATIRRAASPRGQEVRRRVGRDRQGELFDPQLDQRDTQNLRTRDADRVERDIDAARLVDHRLQMPVHGLLVEGVDLRRLGGSAGGNDFLGEASTGARGRPVRNSLAPSDAKARATAPPIAPPAP